MDAPPPTAAPIARRGFDGWINVRALLRGSQSRTSPAALTLAGRLCVLLPLLQGLLVVVVLKGEYWMALLALEGALIGWLSARLMRQSSPENQTVGFIAALLNTVILGGIGLVINVGSLWISSALAFPCIAWLFFAGRGAATRRMALGGFVAIWLALAALAGLGRVMLELARVEQDAPTRLGYLRGAWAVFEWRGGNDAERALLRLRLAQAALEAGDFAFAFEAAHDGLYFADGRARTLPASPLAQELFRSLLNAKAVAFYNRTWGKRVPYDGSVQTGPLAQEIIDHPNVRVAWGY